MVFSTYVEVIPGSTWHGWTSWRILHVCGGDPKLAQDTEDGALVFSTYVEVILLAICVLSKAPSILHVCGGDPVN